MIFLEVIKRNSGKTKELNAKIAIYSWGSDNAVRKMCPNV